MILSDFFQAIEDHKDFEGVYVGEGEFCVRHLPSKVCTVMTADCILGQNWDTLLEIMSAQREPEVLNHMTRVVGYYSMIENMNPSKEGEIKDRRKGNYAI